MIDEQDGVAVRHQVVHDAVQAHDVRRVQTDGRLVEDVQHARRPVPHRAGKLHPLALPRGERGGRPVEGQVGEPQVPQAPCHGVERLADAVRHGPHLLRQRAGDAVHPFDELRQGQPADPVEGDAAHPRRPRGLRQARSAALGADSLLQKLLHPLHALFVLHLRERVFDGIDGVVVGEVHLPRHVGALRLVQDMLFLGGAMVDDVLLPVRQVPEGHVRPHAHRPADVRHERPHQAVPGGHRALVDGQGFVGDKGGFVDGPHRPRSAATPAGPLAVEGQLLGRGRVKTLAAGRARQLPLRRDGQGRLQAVAVGTHVVRKAGEHQADAVQQLRPRAEGGTDAGDARPLMQGQGRRDVKDLVHVRLCRLRHPPPRVGGQGVQIAPGALRVQDSEGQRGLAGPRHPGYSYDFIQRNIHVDVLQVVHPRAADLDFLGRPPVVSHGSHPLSSSSPRRRKVLAFPAPGTS